MVLETFYDACAVLADHLDAQREIITGILATYETAEVVEHEINSSIKALRNIRVEYENFNQPNGKVTASCYLPVNMPLYSLILYGVLPSYYFETIYIRPGMSLSGLMPALSDCLDLSGHGFDQIQIKDLPAKLFTDMYAKDSEVILFTGKYENAQMLERECPDSMLIFEGTGPCPFFIFENADTEVAAQKAVAMRCFNSGQDCVAPDAIFVHSSLAKAFTEKLIQELKAIKVGSSTDPEVRVAQVIKEKYLLSVQKWLERHHENIVYGGEIDTKELVIHPAVLTRSIDEHEGPFMELFSPIFYILTYDNEASLLQKINDESFKKRAMYACVFGENDTITKSLSLCTVLTNMTVNDQEDGNQPYGGYGAIANFVSYQGKRQARPLLISRDVREWILAKEGSHLPDQALQIA